VLESITRDFLPGLKKILRQISGQIALVFLAFAIMVITSYLYVSGLERQHLKRQTESAIAYTQANIAAALVEPEATLNAISETFHLMIAAGEPFEAIKDYLNHITETMASDDRFMTQITGVYGVFDAFNGSFHSGTSGSFYDGIDWALTNASTFADYPWYKAAVAANGKVVVTNPDIDAETGKVSITYARRIFNNEGTPLAVVCMDVALDRISEYVVNTHVTEGSYGILIDQDFRVLGHPHPAYLGRGVRLMNDGESIVNDLLAGKEISERKATDYRGTSSILFVQKLQNGWYMAILAYENKYYQSVASIAIILSSIGFLMAIILNAALIQMAVAKNETDERMQIMFASTPLGASFWDEYMNLIDCNNEVVRLFDLPDKQEFINRFFEFSPERQPDGSLSKEKTFEILRKAMNQDTYRFEWVHQKLNGEQIPTEIIFVRSRYKGRYCLTAYIKDLSGHQAMLREMHKAEIAEENNKMKGKFLATMSHEIRTPMNAILGITEIQMQNKSLPKDTHEALEYIHNSGYMLLGIINDILDLSKVDAGKLELLPATYAVASIIQDIVQLNTMRVGSKRINFALHVDPFTPAELVGDELRIKQILNNLLTNAMKYTESGEVILSVAAEYKALPDGNSGDPSTVTLIFRVRDTGQGIAQDQLDLIFDEYTRFNTREHRVIQGTGLGLSITKRLIDMMHGEISVESIPGKGSTFTVHLPQKAVGPDILGADTAKSLEQFHFNSPTQIKTAQIIRQPMPYGRVLIVDDVETNLYVAKGLLSPYELSIDTAGSGHDAINKIKAGNIYDIVFMDHMMPIMDGIETTKKIRAMGYMYPIVALTANAVSGQAEMFLMNGFDDYISKPIDIRQLNFVLNRLIRDKQSPEALEAMKDTVIINPPEEEEPSLNPELARTFIRDAVKAVEVLKSILEKQDVLDADDIQLYTVTTHAMKSALANIGETVLSASAKRLESAGRKKDTAVILDETPAFLNALQAVISKITPKEEEDVHKAEDDDKDYLQEKLLVFRAACVVYDKKSAKEVIIDLKKKKWSRSTKEMLNLLAERLLHSDFEEAANIARDYEMNFGS
jgi:signal transduction histidine kinase/CheY-like chemotaxis protein